MSSTSTLVTAAHFAYLAARTEGLDDFLVRCQAAAREAGLPPIWVAPEELSLIGILLRLVRARRVVEIGTLAGTTAIGMARALRPGGRVDTIELEPRHAAFAREWIAQSDVADRIVVHEGAGREVLPLLESRAYDAVLLDADKTSYPYYLGEARRLLRAGGLLLADNAFAFGQLLDDVPTDREVPAVRAFNDLVATQDWLRAIIVPIGDGLWVGVAEDAS